MRTLALLVTLASTVAAAQYVESAPPLVQVPLQPVSKSNGVERFKLQGKLVPEGFHVVSAPRWALVGAGAGLFVVGYGSTLAFAAMTNDAAGFVPVAGPVLQTVNAWEWVAAGSTSGWFGSERFWRGFAAVFYTCVTITQTAAQVAGLVLAIVGASTEQRWLERDVAPKVESKPSVSVMPIIRQDTLGLGLTGRF